METLHKKVRLSRSLTLLSFFGLLLLFTLWYLIIHPLETGKPWVIWLVHMLPLAFFIPTMKSGNPRNHAWLCFVLILYFNEAVLAATTRVDTRTFGIIYALLVVVLFTAAMMYARWASQYARLSREQDSNASHV
ncbi:DUF2069 domain-containing protein [Neptunomonas concharum]|uniref:DUF2069 domain-containing protein n=1 Tax=Neptunomonas concharum TaxID=1031538 RepID=A0A5P1RBE2_9GAMM|nr:DUF2069 domain-containing protein [Neptunomonas concharum]QEQ96595.1 DUF2069 domain-containing protein [Neptunomonas concharum]